MFFLKIALLLAATYVCDASDLDKAVWMVKCAREAIIEGIPEMNIPKHTPLYFPASRNIDTQGSNKILGSYHLQVQNLTWAYIPDWELNATQIMRDVDPMAEFKFNLYWKKFVFEGDYKLDAKELTFEQHPKGKITITMEHVDWNGDLELVKPKQNYTGIKFTNLAYTWHAKDVQVNISGSTTLNTLVSGPMALAIKTALNTDVLAPSIAQLMPAIMNERWASKPDKIKTLIEWCKARKV